MDEDTKASGSFAARAMTIGMDSPVVDFHCHGIGPFDFAQPSELVLECIEQQLREELVHAVLTLYVPRHSLEKFCVFCKTYDRMRRNGEISQIVGIAIEGPLFSSVGGTPRSGKWIPTKSEWASFCSVGEAGLRYMVLSPDACCVVEGGHDYPPSMEWILDALYESGVTPALGHFSKDHPQDSALAVRIIVDYVAYRGYPPLFTDHLFNDMPLNFKHAWRGSVEKSNRLQEIRSMGLDRWDVNALEQQLGPVPAALIRASHEGLAKICLNFDGEHVDLEVCRSAVQLIGADNLMMMTDRIQSEVLAGQSLARRDDTSLLYQDDGIVAGGTSAPWQQVANMRRIGLSRSQVAQISGRTAWSALNLSSPVRATALAHRNCNRA